MSSILRLKDARPTLNVFPSTWFNLVCLLSVGRLSWLTNDDEMREQVAPQSTRAVIEWLLMMTGMKINEAGRWTRFLPKWCSPKRFQVLGAGLLWFDHGSHYSNASFLDHGSCNSGKDQEACGQAAWWYHDHGACHHVCCLFSWCVRPRSLVLGPCCWISCFAGMMTPSQELVTAMHWCHLVLQRSGAYESVAAFHPSTWLSDQRPSAQFVEEFEFYRWSNQ